ncbi:PilW family protein [Oceanicoccus sagamiensis]|uniref:Pilus assembly protein PilW n=1 Tax=Oceanicoccus sagamiensis TaxID=716816 RepID=A0A1X9NNK3_9GAMM|nr:PilW family protein [Oceanicoccus sagamiensis]ARN75473.1 hypothetical protein BST96_15965 [Oceanicoccus sagamiensis]
MSLRISQQRQQGLTLIELMISVALASVLMGAALQFITSTRQAYELANDISMVQENGRMALDILTKDVRMAGSRNRLVGDGMVPDFFFSTYTTDSYTLNASTTASALLSNTSDRIAVEYDPPGDNPRPGDEKAISITEKTCLGTDIAAEENIIANVYTVEDRDDDGVNSLYCQSYDVTAASWLDGAPEPLVDGIDNMQVLYGIATDVANPDSVTMYVSADRVSSWSNIRSARISLLVSSGMASAFAIDKLRQYQLLDSGLLSITDRQPRRIYSTTVQFNNTEY